MWKKKWWAYKKSPKSDNKKKSVSFQLISIDRFAINFKNKDIEAFIRKVKSSKFDTSFDLWTLPLSEINSLREYLESQDIPFNDIPKEVFEAMKDNKDENENIDTNLIPKPLFDALLPFQRRGVLFSISKNGKAFVCDEMGLGKTIQAVAISCYYSSEWPLLVIAPSFLKEQWAAEYRRWLPDKALDVNIISTSKNWSISLINIVSYELIASLKDTLFENHKFNVIICDESHYLKSIDAQRTKCVVPILKKAKRRILLTGTPALSRPCELYPQLDALDIPIFPSFKKFAQRYCNAYKGPYGWDYNGASNLAELHSILRHKIMVRRMKNDVLTELPEKERTLNYINADEEKVKAIQESLKKVSPDKLKKVTKNEFNEETMEKKSIFSSLYQETARAKIEATKKYIIDILNNEPEDRKFIVFAYHIEMLDAISECLKAQNVSYIRIDGSTPIKTRTFLVDKFVRKISTRVAVLSITCASSGINLVSASMVIFAEIYWTPGILIQAEDRVHRIGQVSSVVNIKYLLARNTLDDIIWPLIEKKLNVVGKTLNGQREKIDATKVEMSSLKEIRPYILDCFSENNNDHATPKKRRRSLSPTKQPKKKKSTPDENNQTIKDYFHIIENKSSNTSEIIDLSNDENDIIDRDVIDIDCTCSSDTHEIDLAENFDLTNSDMKEIDVYFIDSQDVNEDSDKVNTCVIKQSSIPKENDSTYNIEDIKDTTCRILFNDENENIEENNQETCENDQTLNRFSNLNLANSLLNGKKLSKRKSDSAKCNIDYHPKLSDKQFYTPQLNKSKPKQRNSTGQLKKNQIPTPSAKYPMLKLLTTPTLPKRTVSLSLDKKQ